MESHYPAYAALVFALVTVTYSTVTFLAHVRDTCRRTDTLNANKQAALEAARAVADSGEFVAPTAPSDTPTHAWTSALENRGVIVVDSGHRIVFNGYLVDPVSKGLAFDVLGSDSPLMPGIRAAREVGHSTVSVQWADRDGKGTPSTWTWVRVPGSGHVVGTFAIGY